MKNIKILNLLLCLTIVPIVSAQTGGGNVYDFLNLTNSARVAALGGNNISIDDNDLNVVFHNPSLLDEDMSNSVVLNYVPYMSDISYGYLGFAHHFKNVGTFGLGIHSINYGTFERRNEIAELIGSTSAAEYAFILSYARKLSPNISMGMSVKPIYSKLDVYTSYGITTDFGFHYKKSDSGLSLGIVLKNLGSQISSYNDIQEDIPSDLQFGMSTKLAHAPFRFSLTAQHLLEWDLSYNSTDYENSSDSSTGDVTGNDGFGDKLMRHVVFGVEFLPSKNFHVDFGYNYRRRQELAQEERMSTVGMSWGFGFRVYKFHFSYGSARYHLGGTSNHFSISTNLSSY